MSYIDSNTAAIGSAQNTATFDDIEYHFINNENKNKFEANPISYIPEFGGWCAVGMAFELVNPNFATGKYPVNPLAFRVENGKLYLFYQAANYNAVPDWDSNKASLKPFAENFWAGLIK